MQLLFRMFYVDFRSELEKVFKESVEPQLTESERLAVDIKVARTFFT